MAIIAHTDLVTALGNARLADAPLPADLTTDPFTDETVAYRCQAALADWLGEHGYGAHVGYKIGATTPAMRELIGVPGPIYGHILDRQVHQSRATLSVNPRCQPAIECELSFRIGRDLKPADAPFRRDAIAAAIDAMYPSIELVENRYGDYRTCALGTMIADDFFHKACILADPIKDWRDLDIADLTVTLDRDNSQIETGISANVMDHPLNAVTWLANTLAARNSGLRAGHIVMTGTVTPAHWLNDYPASVRMTIVGCGSCALTVTARPSE